MKIVSYSLIYKPSLDVKNEDYHYIYPHKKYLSLKEKSPAYYFPDTKDFYKNKIIFFCPCGSGKYCCVIGIKNKTSKHWTLEFKDMDIFTLNPSIRNSHANCDNTGNQVCHFYIENSFVKWC